MPSTRLVLACAALAAIAPLAHSAPHVHGAGHLEVVIDGAHFAVTLDMPADAAVGFERPPRTAAEKQAVEAMHKVLRDGPGLFKPTPAAECRLATVDVSTPFGAAAESKHAHGAGGNADGDVHGDIEASYIYQCARPDQLKGLATTLFTHFKRLYRLDVQRAGPAGQGGGRLTPKQPSLNW